MCQVILNKIFSIFKEIFFSTKLMLDRISEENCDDRDMITKHFPRVSLDAPAYTPWFDTWMKYYLQTLPVAEHEFLKHSLGCIFVVSTRSELRTLHKTNYGNIIVSFTSSSFTLYHGNYLA